MARDGDTEINRALEDVVGEINRLVERQDGGPPVVLTVDGLVIGGTIIPDWQWFDEVEHAARASATDIGRAERPRTPSVPTNQVN
jgi:hypothetical protein